MSDALSFIVGADRRCHVAEPCMETLPRVDHPGQQSLALELSPIVRRRIVRHARPSPAALDWIPLGRLWLLEHVRAARSCFDKITRITDANDEPAGKLMLERVRAHLAAALHHLETRVVKLGTSEALALTHGEWTRRLEALRAHIAAMGDAPDAAA